MKRLTWILLAVLCTILVQVRPTDVPATKVKACSCCCSCGAPSTCGMPNCSSASQSQSPARAGSQFDSSATAPAPAERKSVHSSSMLFYLLRFASIDVAQTRTRAIGLLSATHVPLFKAHCCFLI